MEPGLITRLFYAAAQALNEPPLQKGLGDLIFFRTIDSDDQRPLLFHGQNVSSQASHNSYTTGNAQIRSTLAYP